MNLQEIYPIVAQLQATSSSLEKMEILMKHKTSEDLKRFFFLSLDTYTNFYLSPVQVPVFGTEAVVSEDFFTALSDRKVTGNAARSHYVTVASILSQEAQTLLYRILDRDPKCGVQVTTVNKVWPGLVRVFGKMLAVSNNDVQDWEDKVIGRQASLKLDGRRAFAMVGDDFVSFLSREGRPLYNMQEAEAEILKLGLAPGVVLDGEFYDTDWNSSSSIVASKKSSKTSDTWALHVFDMLTKEEWEAADEYTERYQKNPQSSQGWYCRPLRERDEHLTEILKNGTRVIKAKDLGIVRDKAHAQELLRQAIYLGYEGLVFKDLDAPYLKDRDEAWIKAKATETIDAKIVGFESGKAGSKNEYRLGAFVCQLASGDVVNVGGGLKDKDRDQFWNMRGELLGKFLEYRQDLVPERLRKKMKARFPQFVRIRDDKTSF